MKTACHIDAKTIKESLYYNHQIDIDAPSLVKRQGTASMVYYSRLWEGLSSTEIIIKISNLYDSYPTEAEVYREIAQHGVPVPHVLFYCSRLHGVEMPCLIISKIEGIPLDEAVISPGLERQVYENVGRIFRAIHQVGPASSVKGYGLLASSPSNRTKDWSRFILEYHDYFSARECLSRAGLIGADLVRSLASIENRIDAHVFKDVLNHGDLGPDHLLLADGEIIGVIDPGCALIGPAEYDLAYFGLYATRQQMLSVLEGYGGSPDIEQIHAYMAVIALHKAVRAHRIGNPERTGRFVRLARNAATANRKDLQR